MEVNTIRAIEMMRVRAQDQRILADHYADHANWENVRFHLRWASVYDSMHERLLERLVRETMRTWEQDNTPEPDYEPEPDNYPHFDTYDEVNA